MQKQKTKPLYQKTKISLQLSSNGHSNQALQMLKQVKKQIKYLKEKNPQLNQQLISIQIILYNNLACVYNKKKKFKSSLFNLRQVSQLQNDRLKKLFLQSDEEKTPQILHQIATTHSNLCAAFSQMQDHSKALKQIQSAIKILTQNQKTKNSQALIVFYYNYAIELEYLRMFQESQKKLNKGLSLIGNNQNSVNSKEMRPLYDDSLERVRGKIKRKQQRIGDYLEKCIKGYRNPNKALNSYQELIQNKNQNKRELSLNLINYRKNYLFDNKLKKKKIKQNSQRHDRKNSTVDIYDTKPITSKSNLQHQNTIYSRKIPQFPRLNLPKTIEKNYLNNYTSGISSAMQLQKKKQKSQNKFLEGRNKIEMYSMYQPKPFLNEQQRLKKRKKRNQFVEQTKKKFSYKNLLAQT